jgi:hypothetical protein
MKSIHILGIVLSMILFFTGCETVQRTLGSVDRVIVLCDDELWPEIESSVRDAIQNEFNTPQPEPTLIVVQKSPQSLEELKRYPHILFVGTLDAENATKQIVDQLLTEQTRSQVAQDQSYLFKKNDAWARGQLLVAVITKDVKTLKERFTENGEQVYQLIHEHAYELVKDQLYFRYEQKDIHKHLLQEHGWMIRVPHDYFVAIDSAQASFVWLRRVSPQRDIWVYWQETDDPSLLSKEWMLDQRKRIGETYLSGDYIYQSESIPVRETSVDFNGRYAIRLDGVWQNEEYVSGGPFRSYGFYDEGEGRLYMIDFFVFRPGERKWPFMRQLDVIAHTFTTRTDTNNN